MEAYNTAKKAFRQHASLLMRLSASEKIFQRRLKGTFGVSSHVGGMLLYLTTKKFGFSHCPIDKLLIGLRWLKAYQTECNDAIFFNLDEKTIRKWRRIAVAVLSSLELINFEDRKLNWPHKIPSLSIDGIDFAVMEPSSFDAGAWSHKLNRASLRYEIGLGLGQSTIVWASGGLASGAYPDLKIAKMNLQHVLPDDEQAIADSGYKDGDRMFLTAFTGRFLTDFEKKFNYQLKCFTARHEHVNMRLRTFSIMNETFHHDQDQHHMCFAACLNLVQLSIEEEPIMSAPLLY